MGGDRDSLQPIQGAARPARARLDLKGELLLALLPTLTVLAVLGLVEVLTRQRLLFASLASSAFLIYLDPNHGTNTIRALVSSHLIAATAGLGTYQILGHGYPAAASAMVLTILAMVLLDVVHPPAISTSLTFAFRAGAERDAVLFALAVGVTVILVILQRTALWLLARAGA